MNYTSNNIGSVKSGYLPGIDGLRALAVLSVIFFHLKASLLPGGFSGVDVFFVISGYVVSGSLAKDQNSSFWHFAIDFYSRRILRIYPALVLCLIVGAILQTLFVPSSWLSTTSSKTGIAAFFGMSNFALIWFNDGYFSPRVEFNTFTHTWSLAVEEQFYLIFPIVFFISLKGRGRRDFVGSVSNWLLPVLLVTSFAVAWHQTGSTPDQAYYLLPSRFWELACGAMLFMLHAQKKLIFKSRLFSEASIFGGLLLIGMGFIFSNPKSFPFPWAMLPVFGALFVISGIRSDARRESFLGGMLNNAPIVYIGKISYSLYLWHWPVIVICRWTVGLDDAIGIGAAVLCTVIASVLSYQFIELPIRQSSSITSKPNWKIVSGGFGAVTLSAAIAGVIFLAQPNLSLSVTSDKGNWYPYSTEKQGAPGNSQLPNHTFQGRTIYAVGDSHAGAYSTMLSTLAQDTNASVQVLSKGGCSVANLRNASSPECVPFVEEIITKITAEAKSGDIVFLASLRMNRLSDQWATFDESEVAKMQSGPGSGQKMAAALQEAQLIVERFESVGLTVVIDAPKPVFKSPPFRCSDWFNARNPVCKAGTQLGRADLLRHRQPIMESLRQLSSTHPKLVVWDPFPVLCPSAICMTTDNNLPLFFDGDHLSGHGNRILYPSFLAVIRGIW